MTEPSRTDPETSPAKNPADVVGETNPTNSAKPSNEAPDRDTPAWEGAEPTDDVGLVDPRREIPNPPGL